MTLISDADALAGERLASAAACLVSDLRIGARSFRFLRHGRTEANRKGIIQGQRDVPLDDTGRRQAHAAARLLREAGERPARIVSSDLSRAAETARIVASGLGMQVSAHDAGLREKGFGCIEGTDARHLAWTEDAENAEPVADFVARCAGALTRHLQEEDVLIVAHGGVLRAVAALLQSSLPAEARANAVPLWFRRGDASWALEVVEESHL